MIDVDHNKKTREALDQIMITPEEARTLLSYYLSPLCVGYSYSERFVVERAYEIVRYSAQDIMRREVAKLENKKGADPKADASLSLGGNAQGGGR